MEQQALKATSGKKYQKQTWLEAKNKTNGGQRSEASNYDRKKNVQKGKEKYDKKNVQCYCCKNFGHYAKDSWSNKEEAKIARGDSDDEPVLLMDYESDEEPVRLSFSDSEGGEDDFEYSDSEGVFEYESGSEEKKTW